MPHGAIGTGLREVKAGRGLWAVSGAWRAMPLGLALAPSHGSHGVGCGCWVSPGHAPSRTLCSLTSERRLYRRSPALGMASGEPHASAALSCPGTSAPRGLWLLLDCGPVAATGLNWAHSLHSCCLLVRFLAGPPARSLQLSACCAHVHSRCAGAFFCLVGAAVWFKPELHSLFLGGLLRGRRLLQTGPHPRPPGQLRAARVQKGPRGHRRRRRRHLPLGV